MTTPNTLAKLAIATAALLVAAGLAWTATAQGEADDAATKAALENHFSGAEPEIGEAAPAAQAPGASGPDPTSSKDAMVAFFTSEPPADVTVARRRHVDLDIKFGFDSADLSSQGVAQLDITGEALNDPLLTSHRFVLSGHTDDLGDEEYNVELSLRRARAAQQYLIDQHGVDADRLETAGFGSEQQRAEDPTPEARAMNRRVVLEMVE